MCKWTLLHTYWGKELERFRDRTANPSPEETLYAVFLTSNQFPARARTPRKDPLTRFVILFISSSPERPAGALTTFSLSSFSSCVTDKPSLSVDELPASGRTPQPLSLLVSADLLGTLPGPSEPAQYLLLPGASLHCLATVLPITPGLLLLPGPALRC